MTVLSNARFALVFPQSRIGELSARYHDYDEEVVFAAGQRIAAGNLRIIELRTIFEWKTRGRGRSRLDQNTKEAAELGAIELKRRFPMLQIRIYDAGTHARHELPA